MTVTGSPLHRIARRAGIASVSALALFAPASAFAAAIGVTTTADVTASADNLCSLREAVAAARTGSASGPGAGECRAGDPGANTVVLPSGTYVLSGGAVGITSALTLSGAGASTTTIDGNDASRVLQVGAAPAVIVSGLTITGGHAPDGISTGTAAQRVGGSGGAISNIGVLTLMDVIVSASRAGNGLDGNPDPAIGRPGYPGGNGGGIANTGTLTLIRTKVASNRAGTGGTGIYASPMVNGAGGAGGAGGGLHSAAGATLTIADSSITGNTAGNGGAGGAGSPGLSSGASGGTGGAGGGVWNAGTLAIGTSLVAGNGAGRGGTGGGNGGSITPTGGGSGGAGGYGGGLYDASAASETVASSTVAANAAGSGGDGVQGGAGGSGGGGGGVVSAGATLTVVAATISGNQVGGGGAGGGSIGGGGGVNAFGAASLQNTIVAGNSGGNCLGATVDAGHDISYPDASCAGANADPQLGELQDNGGPTATIALGAASAAIDRVPADGAGCPAADQRGLPRPQGAGCDIGAFELGVLPTLLTPPTISVAAGEPLACTPGSWKNAPLTYGYAWLRDGTPIGGATTTAYAPTAADAGHDLVCRVTATNPTGVATADTARVHVPAVVGPGPVVAPPTAPADAPRLTRTSVSPRSFRAAASGASAITYRPTKAQRRSGTRITFTTSAAASVRFTVRRVLVGRAQGTGTKARCVATTKRNAKARRCTRFVPIVGSFTRAVAAGLNRFHFSGRLRGNRLAAGRYVLVATPRAAGKTGPAITIRFTILRS